MHAAPLFLQTLALVFCVAALTTVLFQRLGQPVVFGYLLAGMILGPHIPVPVAADASTAQTLSELGVILLMFTLGLEFNLRRVIQMSATSGLAALAETSVMLSLGYLLADLLGWTPTEALFAGAIVAISSTTIIAKAFSERGVSGPITQAVFGILIVEDLIAIFLVALLSAVAAGSGLTASGLGMTGVRLATFLAGLIGIGLLVVPRLVRAVVRLGRSETTLVASIGICFGAALLALAFGYSVALGAFIAGTLVAESGEASAVRHLIEPVRDMFVAIFFVSVGMLIDPRTIAAHWPAVLAFTLLVMVGKVVAVSVGAFLTGSPLRLSVQAGMSLAQIGEFSFIIAGVGLAAGATRSFLYPVAVAVSAITTFTTPLLIGAARPVALWVDRKLPRPIQTFVALYGSWVERLRTAPAAGRSRLRRMVRFLLVDSVLLAGVIIGASAEMTRLTALGEAWLGMAPRTVHALVVIGALVVASPFVIGIMRSSTRLGFVLAVRAMPAAKAGRADFAAAPRRSFVTTLQLAILFAIGAPLVAVTQPFLPRYPGFAVLAAITLLLGIAFWRSARNLQGHTQAGAQVIVAALAQQMAGSHAPDGMQQTMRRVGALLPGLGEPVPVKLTSGSVSVGRTLADLNIRGLTGATVLAIVRGRGDEEQAIVPTGRERLRANDILAIAGSSEAVAEARAILVRSQDLEDEEAALPE
ncbi:MAG TPA: cation:proton antiporter [Gemmatimonadaceae bacterium]|nr:cation:proton antiporter [Gemmatimonadaceae bacterium]